MGREFVVYCDESVSKGQYYSNFYGGLLVPADRLEQVASRLGKAHAQMGLRSEVKWTSITPSVEERYCELISGLFEELSLGNAKIRVMFTQNRDVPRLTPAQKSTTYHRLYYQFLKHAFGFEHAGTPGQATRIRLLLDKMPSTAERTAQFKSFVASLSHRPEFRRVGVYLPEQHIGEIDSRRHLLAQCLDVVLGGVAFRLNDLHKAKPDGATRRGKRTLAKERVYKHLSGKIREIYPGFNIGVSTGQPNGPSDRWNHAYRHWLFVPRDRERDDSRTKRGKAP